MEFTYVIVFTTQDGAVVESTGVGLFYPTDIATAFKIEDKLWQMAEQYGRPFEVEVHMAFRGEGNGTNTAKRIEAAKAEKTRT